VNAGAMIIIDDLICLFEDGDKDSPPETRPQQKPSRAAEHKAGALTECHAAGESAQREDRCPEAGPKTVWTGGKDH